MTAYATASDVANNILARLASEERTVPWLASETGLAQEHLQTTLDSGEDLTLFEVILIAAALETTVPQLAELPTSEEVSIGSSLRTLRRQAGMTLAETAAAAGTAVAVLSRVEKGQSRPTNAYVAQVTRAIADRLAA